VSVAIWFRLGKETGMSDLFWLADEQIERLQPFFPENHGKPRNELRWRDASSDYGPHKTPYNRWKR